MLHMVTAIVDLRLLVSVIVVSPSSGIPFQLDRVLPVLLPDHLGSRTLWGHLWLRPVTHQMGPHC